MFHVKQFALFLFLTLPFFGYAQGTVVMEKKDFIFNREKDPGVEKFLSGFPELEKLDPLEQESFYWINLLRKDPAAFSQHYLEPFVEQFPELKDSYVRSLKKELRESPPLGMIAPAAIVQKEADRHANDLAKRLKKISHETSSGRSFSQRMADAGIKRCAGENVFEGEADALQALLLLLIDQGVPNLGHRKALLNPSFNIMGVSAEPTSDSVHFIVQLFSCQ
jgi:hypothetical protein